MNTGSLHGEVNTIAAYIGIKKAIISKSDHIYKKYKFWSFIGLEH